jgi:hypothetical protein
MLEVVNQLSARDYRNSLVYHFMFWIKFSIDRMGLRFQIKYREYINRSQTSKNIYHIRSIEQILQFLELIQNQT